jgi:hypothetical protein
MRNVTGKGARPYIVAVGVWAAPRFMIGARQTG